MFRRAELITSLATICFLVLQFTVEGRTEPFDKPPTTAVDSVVDDYFGTKIVDPYRWMESGPMDKRYTEHLRSQNDYSRLAFNGIAKARSKLLGRIKELNSSVASIKSWQQAGGNIFYLDTAPGASTAVLMQRDKSGGSHELLDPSIYDQAGAHSALDYFKPSNDGKYIAVGVSVGGSENSTIRVIDVESKKLLPDAIDRAPYGLPSWRNDSKSFYYARQQKLKPGAPEKSIKENQKVFLHKLGASPSEDTAIFGPGVSEHLSIPSAGYNGVILSADSPFVFAFHTDGGVASIYVAANDPVQTSEAHWRQIISPEDGQPEEAWLSLVAHGDKVFLLNCKNAPNRKVISIDLHNSKINRSELVVPESNKVILGIYGASDGLYTTSREGTTYYLQRFPWHDMQHPEEVKLPNSERVFGVESNPFQPGVLLGLESWTTSGQVFRYCPETKFSDIGLMPKNTADFSRIESREVKVSSTDGVQVPMTILCQKNLGCDGSHPCIEEGYGAYGLTTEAAFDPGNLAWLERGGVIATVNPRGGGYYGESWHWAGCKTTKQHTVDDMLAGAHYLVDNKYTSPGKLAIKGTSAGGIACGGAIVQNPGLFAVAIDNVGMTDMLRFQTSRGGAENISEFGDVENPHDFEWLHKMSAYHHVRDRTAYPAFLGVTGVNDSRVPSWVVAKMVARLQAASSSGRPVLLRVDFDAGHGPGSNRNQREEQYADECSFVLWQTNDPEFQPALR